MPEAHTDYIFAVAGEEFGMIACFCLALLYLGIIIRVALQLLDEEDPFVFLATAGLVAEFGLQAFINMSVNLSLLPSKGMTLPFISHGGSSFIAMAFTMGMVLAFTRGSRALRASPFAPRSLAGRWHEPAHRHRRRRHRRSHDPRPCGGAGTDCARA
nr:FtsW/RodA/SpoVE family cell cycle protein [Hankyongella ginsenosidimutans]